MFILRKCSAESFFESVLQNTDHNDESSDDDEASNNKYYSSYASHTC